MEPGESQASSRDLCMLSMCTRGAPPCEVSRGCHLCVEYFAHQGNQLSRNRSLCRRCWYRAIRVSEQGSSEARLRMLSGTAAGAVKPYARAHLRGIGADWLRVSDPHDAGDGRWALRGEWGVGGRGRSLWWSCRWRTVAE